VSVLVGGLVETVAIGGGYGSFRAYGAFVADRTDAAGAIRRALSIGLPVLFVLTAFGLHAAGVDAAVRDVLPVAGRSAGIVVLSAGGYAAALAGHRATVPVDAAVRDVDVDPGTQRRQFAAFAGSVVVAADVVLVALLARTVWVPALAVCGVAAGFYVLAAPAVEAMSATRAPTPAERARLGPAMAGDLDARVRVLETDATRWAGAYVRGPPRRRTLFVASHLLGAHPDAGVAAVTAIATGRAERWYFATTVGSMAALGVAVVAVATGAYAVAAVAACCYALGCVRARRALFAADADARRATSLDAVVTAQRRIAADADVSPDAGGFLRYALRGRASRAERLERLRAS